MKQPERPEGAKHEEVNAKDFSPWQFPDIHDKYGGRVCVHACVRALLAWKGRGRLAWQFPDCYLRAIESVFLA